MAAPSCFLRSFETSMAQETDAPPIFHRAVGYSIMGALLSRQDYRCVLNEGVNGTWTNLWVVLVGDSGHDHKSTCIDMGVRILALVDETLQGPDDMSPEGLCAYLGKRDLTEHNPSVLMVQGEFINLLLQLRRQYSQVLRPMLMAFYDVLPAFKRQLKKEEVIIHNPRMSMVGGIPVDMLAQYGQPEDWVGGFFNRCLLVMGKKSRKQDRRPRVPDEVYSKLALGLKENLEVWRERMIEEEYPRFAMSRTADKLTTDLQGDDSDSYHLRTMLSRSTTHWVKIAAIEQIDEDPKAKEIGVNAAMRAGEFIKAWQKELPWVVSNCMTRNNDDFAGDKLAKSVLRYLFKGGGKSTKMKLLNSCGISYEHMDKALNSLNHAGRIKYVQSDEEGGETQVVLVEK